MFDLDDKERRNRTGYDNISLFQHNSLFDTMGNAEMSRTSDLGEWLPKIAEAGLAGDARRLEIVIVRAIRSLKSEMPEVCERLAGLLSEHSTNPHGLRWRASGPPPVDAEEGFSLVRFESVEDAPSPVIPAGLSRRIEQFVRERSESRRLVEEGFLPPGSLLLTGAPGTGKTMLSRWIARELRLPFISLDLATAISSFLGKTGFNLRRALDYARSQPCLLLLDEFDAIGKRRDDETEIGELKRIVNVLLKELEEWPLQSVLVAATNHPELLDRAIARRFDLVLNLPLPGEAERLEILKRAARRFSDAISEPMFRALARGLEGVSGSDLDSLMNAAVRQHLAGGEDLVRALVEEFRLRLGERLNRQNIGELLRSMQTSANGAFTVRELAELFGKSASTVQHHLKKEAEDG